LPSLLAGICTLGVLSACDVTIKDGDVSFDQFHGRATREVSRTYPLEAGGRVEIVNTNGPVDVTPGAPGAVELKAVMTARAMSEDRAKEVLADAKIDETASTTHVRIATIPGGRRGRLSVSYKVAVPPDAQLEVSINNGHSSVDGLRGHVKTMLVNGNLAMTGLRGPVDAASVNGRMTVRMAEVTGRVRLEGTNGQVTLELPKNTKATLSARAVNGGLSVTGLTAQEASGRRIRSVESQLNGGGPEIDVRVTNGRISIVGIDPPGQSGSPATNPASR
jgi:DUF4097 and DUF4098 domain-containing protein YvlB